MRSVYDSEKTKYYVVDGHGIFTAPPQSEVAAVDTMTRAEAEVFARRMARYREAGAGESAIGAASEEKRDLRLFELIGIEDIDTYDPREMWAKQEWNPGLDVALGTLYRDGEPTGEKFVLNLGTGESGGKGPHCAYQGQSGSGKSVFLESMALCLCAWHPPEKLNLLIVDFKGEASFKGFDKLSHVVGMVNDTGDPEILSRLSTTLLGEIEGRKILLAQEQERLGISIPDIGKYLLFRKMGMDLKPLPMLVVLIDEASIFSKYYGSEFTSVFQYIVKQGRSVGVFVHLASQELGFLQSQTDLWAEMTVKSSLIVNSDALSRAVLKDTDAWEELVASRVRNYKKGGHIFFRFTGSDIVHLRAANNLLEYRKQGAAAANEAVSSSAGIAPHTLANQWRQEERQEPASEQSAEGSRLVADGAVRTDRSEVSVLLEKLAIPAETERRNLWTPPLRKPVTFAQLGSHHALAPTADQHSLVFPLGVVDDPWNHVQHVLTVDFNTNAGSLLIAGTAKSGRTTAVSTLIVASAFLFAPRHVSWLVVDQGGRLGAVRSIPHIAGYARHGDNEMRDQIFSEVQRVITLRSRLFTTHGFNTTREYLDWREQNPQPGDPYGYLFVAIDGWISLKAQLGQEDTAGGAAADGWVAPLGAMIETGPNYGVHMVVTTDNGSTDLPGTAQKSVSVIYLRGSDSSSELGAEARQVLRDFPANQPGLALDPATVGGKNKNEVRRARVAVPIPTDVPEPAVHDIATMTATDHNMAIAAFCAEIKASAAPGQRAHQLKPLPVSLRLSDLWPAWREERRSDPSLPGRPQRGVRIPLGLGGADMAPVGVPWSADPAKSSPHLVVLGRPQSGRTNTLALLAAAVMGSFSPSEARIVLLDERGAMNQMRRLLLREQYLAGHADRERTQKCLAALLVEARRRVGEDEDVSPVAEEQQTFFDGPEIFLLVDNIEAYRNNMGSSPQAAPLLAELVRIRQRIGLHVWATTTHEAFSGESARPAELSPLAALDESRAHIVSLAAASRTSLRGGIRPVSFHIPGRASLISDLVPAAANGKPPIIQIPATTIK